MHSFGPTVCRMQECSSSPFSYVLDMSLGDTILVVSVPATKRKCLSRDLDRSLGCLGVEKAVVCVIVKNVNSRISRDAFECFLGFDG